MKRKTFWFLFSVFLAVITGCGSGGSSDTKAPFTRTYFFAEGSNPTGVAVAPNGDVYQCSLNAPLVKYTNFGKPVGTVPQQATVLDPAELQRSGITSARDVAVSPRDGTVYVLGFDAVKVGGYIGAFAPDGRFLFRFGHDPASGRVTRADNNLAIDRAGNVSVPGNVSVGQGTSSTYEVSVFDASGNYLRSIEKPGDTTTQPMVAVDKDDNLYINSTLGTSVFSPSGQLLREIAMPEALNDFVVDSKGNLYIAHITLLQKYSPNGKLLAESVRTIGVLNLAIDAADNLYVAGGSTSVFPQN